MKEVLVQALSLIAIICLGQIIRRLGWFDRNDFSKLSRLMLSVTLPAVLVTNFNSFQIDMHLFFIILIGAAVNMIQSVASFLLHRKQEKKEKAFAVINGNSYNIGAFAMPYLEVFMGPESLIWSSLFDIGNAVTSAGVNYSWGMGLAGDQKTGPLAFLRRMLKSPVFVTYLFLMSMQVLHIRLPEEIIHFTGLVGQANTFLAMFIIGLGLELKLSRTKLKKAFRMLLQRYFFAVFFLLLTWFLLPADPEIKKCLCLLYFAPIAAMTPGFTAEIKGDIELSSFLTSVSIIVAIIMMPLILAIL